MPRRRYSSRTSSTTIRAVLMWRLRRRNRSRPTGRPKRVNRPSNGRIASLMSGRVMQTPTTWPATSASNTCSGTRQLRQPLGHVLELGVGELDESPQVPHRGVVDRLAAGNFGGEVVGAERADGDAAAPGQPFGARLPLRHQVQRIDEPPCVEVAALPQAPRLQQAGVIRGGDGSS